MGEEDLIEKTRILLDYYKYATTKGKIENADIIAKDENVSCGDVVQIYIKLDNQGKVKEAKFEGKGCIISQASAAILTEMIIGRSIEDLTEMNEKELLDAIGIPLGPVRLKCALLSYRVLKKGIINYLSKNTNRYQKE